MKLWFTGNYLEFQIEKDHVENIAISGCDGLPLVTNAMKDKELKKELMSLDKQAIVNELSEYGAWDNEELLDHESNIIKLLWLAAWDISENILIYKIGDEVFWNDPANETSRNDIIHSIDYENETATISEGNTEVYLSELY